MPTTGGQKLKAHLLKAKGADGIRGVAVGFFEDAKYPDGTPVTSVAAWNEFGTNGGGWGGPIPERPFFRQAVAGAKEDVAALLREHIDAKTMVVDQRTAELLGLLVEGKIRESITKLEDPPNSPVTVALKGSSNPLIDTGFMRTAVSSEILQ